MPAAADPEIAAIFRRPFAEQVAFFRGKLGKLVPTATWRDLLRAEHDRAFMVAGAAKADLLADLAAAVDKAIADGESLDKFRKRFADLVQRHGWEGWTGSDTESGRAWRTRVIYQTNLSTSYAAGRLVQLQDFPLWVYRHGGSRDPRPQHLAWNGLTLPANHKFWKTHYPPSAWGCTCYVLGARNAAGAQRLGATPGYTAPPAGWDVRDARGNLSGVDAGWDYQPGGSWTPWDKNAFTPECGASDAHAKGVRAPCIRAIAGQQTFRDFGRPRLRDVPDDQRLDAPALLERAASRAQALQMLADVLGVSPEQPRRWVQTQIPVDAFTRILVDYGYLSHMVDKDADARERYANFVMPTLVDPFEVWATRYDDGTIRPRLIGLFKGKKQMALILRINRDGSMLYNMMQADDARLDDFRTGAPLYGK